MGSSATGSPGGREREGCFGTEGGGRQTPRRRIDPPKRGPRPGDGFPPVRLEVEDRRQERRLSLGLEAFVPEERLQLEDRLSPSRDARDRRFGPHVDSHLGVLGGQALTFPSHEPRPVIRGVDGDRETALRLAMSHRDRETGYPIGFGRQQIRRGRLDPVNLNIYNRLVGRRQRRRDQPRETFCAGPVPQHDPTPSLAFLRVGG